MKYYKATIFCLFLIGWSTKSISQETIRFVYIGADSEQHVSVAITSEKVDKLFNGPEDSIFEKVFYTDQRAVDTIKAYIAKNSYVYKTLDRQIKVNERSLEKTFEYLQTYILESSFISKGSSISDHLLSGQGQPLLSNIGKCLVDMNLKTNQRMSSRRLYF